jgi:uncharacterized protein (DUF1499 family)
MALLLTFVSACAATPPPTATPQGGDLLPPCPSSPNCVSSEATDPGQRVEPLTFQGDPARAMDRLHQVIVAMPRTRIVEADPESIQAEFTSLIFRFVDDVQCRLNRKAGVIEIRSASRVGYSDLGANRRRVEAIRQAFAG